MILTVEQIAEEALALPSEARALLADRLVESLDPTEDGYIQQLWSAEVRRRRDDVRAGRVQTIPGDKALERVGCEAGDLGKVMRARKPIQTGCSHVVTFREMYKRRTAWNEYNH